MEFTLGGGNRRPSDLDVSVVARFPYLAKLAQSGGFAKSFECGSITHRSAICQRRWKPQDYGFHPFSPFILETPLPSVDQKCHTVIPPWPEDYTFSIDMPMGLSPTAELTGRDYALNPATTFDMALDDYNVCLSARCFEMLDAIRQAIIHKQRNSIITLSWSASIEVMGNEFFSPDNVKNFLALFWSCWYPNWPTIHRSTFDPLTSRLTLVISVVLLGACLSTNERDRAVASLWLNVVEEMVFLDDVFSGAATSESLDDFPTAHLGSLVSLLQAGYCVCLLQTWEGSKESKRRVRRNRYNCLIWVSVREVIQGNGQQSNIEVACS